MNKNLSKVVGLLLGVISLICIIISMFQEGNNIFLGLGLFCNCISLVLFIFVNKQNK